MGLLKGRVLFQIPDENSLAMRPKCDVLPKGSTRYLRMKPKVPKPLDNRGEKVFPETGRILAAALMPSKAWQLLLLALTGACIYSGTLNHTFQFDSIQQIVENPYIRELKLWWEYTHNRRSFTIFSFALNYHFVEFDVKYWRIVNIIIHLLNAFLVRWLVQLIFKSPAMKESPMGRYSEPIAFFTALLFVAHPLATQSVTYVVQRATSMGVLFYLLFGMPLPGCPYAARACIGSYTFIRRGRGSYSVRGADQRDCLYDTFDHCPCGVVAVKGAGAA